MSEFGLNNRRTTFSFRFSNGDILLNLILSFLQHCVKLSFKQKKKYRMLNVMFRYVGKPTFAGNLNSRFCCAVAILTVLSVKSKFVSYFGFSFVYFCLSLKFEVEVVSCFPYRNPVRLISLPFVKQYWGLLLEKSINLCNLKPLKTKS